MNLRRTSTRITTAPILAALVVTFLINGLAVAQQRRVSAKSASSHQQAASLITQSDLKEYLSYIASDELQGRDTPSKGLDMAADYIATHLKSWGLRPAGDDGTYFQRIELTRSAVDPAKTSLEVNGQSFEFGRDFLSTPMDGHAEGGFVYAGHGWVIKSRGIDSYKGIDVTGKFVILIGGQLPEGVTFDELSKGERGVDWVDPQTYAKEHGAVGIVNVVSFDMLARWNDFSERWVKRGSIQVTKFMDEPVSVPSFIAGPSVLAQIFRGEPVTAEQIFIRRSTHETGDSFALKPEKTAKFTIGSKVEKLQTQNVVAILDGTDPALKDEYVAIGAHYDHVGVGRPVNGDAIYNGADDDGSGTVAVLEIAKAFARSHDQRRSLLFVWHCGEEKGLWGSQYFTENPTVPIDKIVTQLNIDMIGRSRKPDDASEANRSLATSGEVYVIGSKLMSTELGELSERVNNDYLKLNYNYLYDRPDDPQRFFYRSDHYNYAKKGIPIIFYFTGPHEHYHRPSDQVETIDFDQLERIARTVFMTAYAVADLPTRPKVDKPLTIPDRPRR